MVTSPEILMTLSGSTHKTGIAADRTVSIMLVPKSLACSREEYDPLTITKADAYESVQSFSFGDCQKAGERPNLDLCLFA